MAGEWIKCPRCDLNYMRKGEEYCDVCKAQLKKGPQLVFAIDDEDDSDLDTMELCPICHQNYMKEGEKMCKKCAEDLDYKETRDNPDDDESWKEFLDQDDDIDEEESEEMLSLAKLAEGEGSELFDDEEEEEDIISEEVEEDFDLPTGNVDDYEEDEDEYDEEEEEEDDE